MKNCLTPKELAIELFLLQNIEDVLYELLLGKFSALCNFKLYSWEEFYPCKFIILPSSLD